MAKQPYPLSEAYRLLEPGPVVLLTTAWHGRRNVMAQSWHCMLEFEPPTVAMVVSEGDYTFGLLSVAKDCVINLPTEELAAQVVGCGNTSGRDTDKFAAFHLTAEPASRVGAPLIGECYASLECQVADTTLVDAYNLFILEVVAAWVDPAVERPRTLHHRGQGAFAVAERVITLPSRMK